MGKVIGIISVKGGVGKTSCTSNIGAALAYNHGKKVLLVDANFSAPNLGLHLGIVDPGMTIHDVMLGKCSILQSIYEYDDNFHMIPAKLNYRKRIEYKNFKSKLSRLKRKYDYILLDSSPSLNSEIKATLDASDALFVITTADFPTIATTISTVNEAATFKKPVLGLIVNKYCRWNSDLSKDDIESTVGVEVVSFLQNNNKMMKSLSKTTPFVMLYPRSKLAKQFKELASKLL
jgi:septum site-determining protein MinD